MFVEVEGERFPCPSALRLDGVKRNTPEEVLESAANAEAVSFDVSGEAQVGSELRDAQEELFAGERAE